MKREALILMFAAGAACAADLPAWVKPLQLRQSIHDKNLVGNPAELYYLDPEKGDSHYAVDGGLSYDLASLYGADSWRLAPSAEWHRKSQEAAPQDILRFGLAGQLDTPLSEDAIWKNTLSVNRKFDRVADTEANTAQLNTYLFDGFLRMGAFHPNDVLPFDWLPTLGIELEDINESSNGDGEGTVTRGKAAVRVFLYPLYHLMGKTAQLEVALNYAQAWDLSESDSLKDSDDAHGAIDASVTYYVDEERRAGLTAKYFNGEDPSQNLEQQSLTRVGLTVKF